MLANIAIDGPAACGKTTVAALLAQKLGLVYLDTGAMYRAAAWQVLQAGVSLDDSEAIAAVVKDMALVVRASTRADGHDILVNGRDITSLLHTPEVTAAVPAVACVSAVRRDMVRRQQALAAEGGIVMAGRDICTVVLPDAQFKYYIDASLEERARRRAADLAASGRTTAVADVSAQLAERDKTDSGRADSPLMIAADAVRIDSTSVSAEQVVARIVADYRGAFPQ